MVMPAEQCKVIETRLTAVCPVLDVVTIAELVVGTAREAATAISGLQCTSHSRRNRTRAASDVEWLTGLVFFDGRLAAIARNAFRCFRGNAGSVLNRRDVVRGRGALGA